MSRDKSRKPNFWRCCECRARNSYALYAQSICPECEIHRACGWCKPVYIAPNEGDPWSLGYQKASRVYYGSPTEKSSILQHPKSDLEIRAADAIEKSGLGRARENATLPPSKVQAETGRRGENQTLAQAKLSTPRRRGRTTDEVPQSPKNSATRANPESEAWPDPGDLSDNYSPVTLPNDSNDKVPEADLEQGTDEDLSSTLETLALDQVTVPKVEGVKVETSNKQKGQKSDDLINEFIDWEKPNSTSDIDPPLADNCDATPTKNFPEGPGSDADGEDSAGLGFVKVSRVQLKQETSDVRQESEAFYEIGLSDPSPMPLEAEQSRPQLQNLQIAPRDPVVQAGTGKTAALLRLKAWAESIVQKLDNRQAGFTDLNAIVALAHGKEGFLLRIDTGRDFNLMAEDVARRLTSLNDLANCDLEEVVTLSARLVPIIGCLKLTFFIDGLGGPFKTWFYVVPDRYVHGAFDALLGESFTTATGILKEAQGLGLLQYLEAVEASGLTPRELVENNLIVELAEVTKFVSVKNVGQRKVLEKLHKAKLIKDEGETQARETIEQATEVEATRTAEVVAADFENHDGFIKRLAIIWLLFLSWSALTMALDAYFATQYGRMMWVLAMLPLSLVVLYVFAVPDVSSQEQLTTFRVVALILVFLPLGAVSIHLGINSMNVGQRSSSDWSTTVPIAWGNLGLSLAFLGLLLLNSDKKRALRLPAHCRSLCERLGLPSSPSEALSRRSFQFFAFVFSNTLSSTLRKTDGRRANNAHQTTVKLSLVSLVARIKKAISKMIEPKIPSGKFRIRYRCACGARLWDDYPAHLEVQGRNLAEDLDRHFRQVERRTGENHKAQGIRQMFKLVLSDLLHFSNSLQRRFSGLVSRAKVDSESQELGSLLPTVQGVPYYLTSFPSMGDRRPRLVQVPASAIQGDKKYFAMLRTEAQVVQRRWIKLLIPRKIKAIRYVQMHLLHDNQHVDILESAESQFPKEEDEYAPDERQLLHSKFAYLGSNTLLHFFEKEHDCCEYPSALTRIPKKLKGKLSVPEGGCPTTGWGMQLVDGIDTFRLGMSGSAGLLVSSLIGIVWASIGNDVQGGSGISQCLMYFVTFVVTMHGVAEIR